MDGLVLQLLERVAKLEGKLEAYTEQLNRTLVKAEEANVKAQAMERSTHTITFGADMNARKHNQEFEDLGSQIEKGISLEEDFGGLAERVEDSFSGLEDKMNAIKDSTSLDRNGHAGS